MPKIKGPELINISKFIINKIKDAPREYCSVEDETGNLFLTNGNQTIVELFRQYFKESKLSEVHKKFPMNKFPSQWQLNRFHKLLYQQEFITRKGPCNASRYYIGLIPQEKESIIRKTAKSAEEMINEAVANFKEALQGIKDEEIQNKIAEAKKEIEEELKTLFDQIKVEKKEIEKMRASTRRRIIELFAEINKEGKDKLQETAVNVLGFSQKKLTDIINFLKNIQKKLEQNK